MSTAASSAEHARAARAILLALPLAVVVVALGELALLPRVSFAPGALRYAVLPTLSLGAVAWLCAPVVVVNVALACFFRFAKVSRLASIVACIVAAGAVGAAVAAAIVVVKKGPQGMSALVAFVVAASAIAWTTLHLRSRLLLLLRVVVPGAVAALAYVSLRALDRESTAAEPALVIAELALVQAALVPLLARSARSALVVPAALVVVVATLAAVFRFAPILMDAKPALLAHTPSGRASLGTAHKDFEPVAAAAAGDVDDAAAYFRAHSGLPALPEGFVLERHNVLLVMVDTLRMDQTSIGDPLLSTTPHLAALAADENAVTFTRAYAPSTCTSQSVAALMSMHTAGGMPFEVWKKQYQGKLLDEAVTVPELLHAGGFATFRVSHNLYAYFEGAIVGLDDGWDHNELVPSPKDDPNVDAHIAASTKKQLEQQKQERRFFGWSFFASPHTPFLLHDKKKPHKTKHEQYRQEVAYSDAQLAVIVDELKQRGLYDDTIILFMGDHGEELGEHKGSSHSRTVYAEVTHVPLVVRVPGLAGARTSVPVSTTYVLPWLLLGSGNPETVKAVERALAADIVPLMKATQNAVVSELYDARRTRTALVQEKQKVHYDTATGLHELFLADDPLDQRDVYGVDAQQSQQAAQLVRDHRAARAQTQKLVLKPNQNRSKTKK